MRDNKVRDTHKCEEYRKTERKQLRHNSLSRTAFISLVLSHNWVGFLKQKYEIYIQDIYASPQYG